MINVEFDADGLLIKLDKLSELPTKAIKFDRLGVKAKELILERTEEGKDVHNQPFVEYSNGYLKFKKDRGGKFFNGTVNLIDEGNMLASISSKSNKDSATVFFLDSLNSKKAHGHNTGEGVNPKREFFGLSDLDKLVLSDMVDEDICDYMRFL